MNDPNCSRNEKFALVIATVSKTGSITADKMNWQNFAESIPKNTCTIGENANYRQNLWQIPLETDLLFLAELARLAGKYGISINVAYLAEAPIWIKYPPDATETP